MGLTLRARRGGPALRLSKFDPVDCEGRMPERTLPTAMARRVRAGIGSNHLSLRRQSLSRTWSGIAGANIVKGDGPKGEGRNARSQPWRFRPHLSLRQIRRSPLRGASLNLEAACRGICSSHPWDSPSAHGAEGQPFGCPNSIQSNLSNPGGFVHTSLSARYAKSPLRGSLRIWRRERDSNPR